MNYTLQTLEQYDVNRAGAVEVNRQSLYDFQLYPTAGQTSLTFFANPQGQGLSSSPGFAGNAKVLADTNMTLAGQLPAPQAFIIETIEIVFIPGSVSTANTFTPAKPAQYNATPGAALIEAANDVNAVMNSGVLTMLIGSKEYLQEAPLFRFPQKAYVGADAAVSAANGTSAAMASMIQSRAQGRPYYMDPPLTLRATQNFNIKLSWPAAVATPSGFNGRIGVILDGVMYRNAQ